MGWPKRLMMWFGVAIVAVGLSHDAWANIPGTSDETRDNGYINGILTKFGRGVSNIVTSPLELLRTPALVGRRQGNLAGMTVGVAQGAWRTLERAAVGVFEVATFFAEVPDNFEPIMKPEFVYTEGDWVE